MILFIQNCSEGRAGIFIDGLRNTCKSFRVVHAFSGERFIGLSNIEGVIVLGGPMSVYDTNEFPFLTNVMEFMKNALARKIPLLGVCLGGQLLAGILGAKIHLQTNGEIGWHTVFLNEEGMKDPLFQGFEDEFVTFQWHNDCFELPSGTIHLASSKRCLYQAFRWGPNAYGIQFHPEVVEEMLVEWIGEGNRADLISDYRHIVYVYRSSALLLLHNFLQIISSV